MKKKLFIVLCLFTLFLSAQNPADFDRTFVPVHDELSDSRATALAVQSDGKIIKGGYMSDGHIYANRITRLNTNGTRDLYFNLGEFDEDVYSIAIQADGKIIGGGTFSTFNGIETNKIIRLNTDGTKDTSFNIGTGFSGSVTSIVIQSDGKIIIVGHFTAFNGIAVNGIIRLNSNGTIDTSFITGSGFNSRVYSITIQSDGKIIAAGGFTAFNGIAVNGIIRLKTDGTRDTSFNIGTGFKGVYDFPSYASSIAMQTDGKFIVGGGFTSYNGVATNKIIRLNTDGTKDTSFEIGTGFDRSVYSIAIQSDGKIISIGSFTTFNGIANNGIIRLNTDGTKDASFKIGKGIEFYSEVYSITILSDEKIIIGGDFSAFNEISVNGFTKLNIDGTRDMTFNPVSWNGFNKDVYSIAIQPDEKIIVGGLFTTFNGIMAKYIIRLNGDCTRDTSFNIGTGFDDFKSVESIAIQSDGKILVGGSFTTFNGIAAKGILRLNIDGTRDALFNIGTGFDYNVTSISIQPNGKIIAGGSFSTFNGIPAKYIVRLNADGTRDTSFNTGTGFNAFVESTVIQSDGKIILGGDFTTFNGISAKGIIRLNSNGTKDTLFNTGTGFSMGFRSGVSVQSIAIQSNEKIIAGGDFTVFNGISAKGIIRLNEDGTRDPSFNTATGFNDFIKSIAIQTDGKIIVGGGFTDFNEIAAKFTVRLNDDGTRDTSFNTGTGFDGLINTIAIQPNSKIVIGGVFMNYMSIPVSKIVRFSGSPLLNVAKFSRNSLSLYPNPAKDILHLNLDDSSTPNYYEIYDLLGKNIKSESVFQDQINIKNLSKGMYILKVKTDTKTFTAKFLKV